MLCIVYEKCQDESCLYFRALKETSLNEIICTLKTLHSIFIHKSFSFVPISNRRISMFTYFLLTQSCTKNEVFQFPGDLVTFTEKILNEKLHFFMQCNGNFDIINKLRRQRDKELVGESDAVLQNIFPEMQLL